MRLPQFNTGYAHIHKVNNMQDHRVYNTAVNSIPCLDSIHQVVFCAPFTSTLQTTRLAYTRLKHKQIVTVNPTDTHCLTKTSSCDYPDLLQNTPRNFSFNLLKLPEYMCLSHAAVNQRTCDFSCTRWISGSCQRCPIGERFILRSRIFSKSVVCLFSQYF